MGKAHLRSANWHSWVMMTFPSQGHEPRPLRQGTGTGKGSMIFSFRSPIKSSGMTSVILVSMFRVTSPGMWMVSGKLPLTSWITSFSSGAGCDLLDLWEALGRGCNHKAGKDSGEGFHL